jgi:hypothetical protein
MASRLGISVSRLIDYEAGCTRGIGTPAPIPRVVELAIKQLVTEVQRGDVSGTEHSAPVLR